MKNIIFVTGLVSMIMILTAACEKENIMAKPVSYDRSYSSHPKNSIYQAAVNKSFDKGLPGISVAVYTAEDGLWEGSAGYACIENNVPMTPRHIQYAASIPKSFTAVAILKMIEQGKLSFDSNIGSYLDENIREYIPDYEKITVRHLLNHTSGLPDQVTIDFMADFMNDPDYFYTEEELISYHKGQDLMWEPGTKHYYSDGNYNLLAHILDNLTGDHVKYFQDSIFHPLGFEDTYYDYEINQNTVENLVSAYIDTYSDGILQNLTEWENVSTGFFKGSGGMVTTPYDLTLFASGVFGGTILSEETIELIFGDTVHNPLSDQWMNDSYGLGFMVIHDEYGTWYGHAGRDPGAAGYVFCNPEKQVTIAAMTNIGTFFSLHYTQIFYGILWSDLCEAIFNDQ